MSINKQLFVSRS